MELSLSRLPWYAQIGAFVVVSACAVGAFWKFYVTDMEAEIVAKRARLTALSADIRKGVATARRLPEFQAQVGELQQRLDTLRQVLPEEKDLADILRRVQGLATQSNLTIQRFTPQEPSAQQMYVEVPFKLQAEGTYHDLGLFFDRISKFPRIISIGDLNIEARQKQEPQATIVAECLATTFVLHDGKAAGAAQKPGKTGNVPKQPGVK